MQFPNIFHLSTFRFDSSCFLVYSFVIPAFLFPIPIIVKNACVVKKRLGFLRIANKGIFGIVRKKQGKGTEKPKDLIDRVPVDTLVCVLV